MTTDACARARAGVSAPEAGDEDRAGGEQQEGEEGGAHPAGQCGKRPCRAAGRWLDGQLASARHGGGHAARSAATRRSASSTPCAPRSAARGAAGSTFDHVAREAGVSRGLLHYYFGTKERLLVEVVRRDSDLRLAALDAAIAAAHTADDLLARARVARSRTSSSATRRSWRCTSSCSPPRGATPEIAAELAALHRRIREHVAEQLEAKAREGVISPTADAESVVTVLLSLADGLALRMLADPGARLGPDARRRDAGGARALLGSAAQSPAEPPSSLSR